MKESDRALAAAISHVCREAQTHLTGNVYYMVWQKLTELREIILNDGDHRINGQPYDEVTFSGLEASLDVLRLKIETLLCDNRYYLAAHKLDVLAFIAKRAAKPRQVAPPASFANALRKQSEQTKDAAITAQTKTANAA